MKAAEEGTVAYAGSDVKGYGKLVLVRHANGYVSAYAHNGEIDVKPGDKVKRGQTIAKSGASGNVTSPQLHFEIRKGGSPGGPDVPARQQLSGPRDPEREAVPEGPPFSLWPPLRIDPNENVRAVRKNRRPSKSLNSCANRRGGVRALGLGLPQRPLGAVVVHRRGQRLGQGREELIHRDAELLRHLAHLLVVQDLAQVVGGDRLVGPAARARN